MSPERDRVKWLARAVRAVWGDGAAPTLPDPADALFPHPCLHPLQGLPVPRHPVVHLFVAPVFSSACFFAEEKTDVFSVDLFFSINFDGG